MIYSVGTMVGKGAVYIPKAMLTESVVGQIYELQIKTEGILDPEGAAVELSRRLAEKFGVKLLYFEADRDVITIQIEGSPFTWSALLLFLPEILIVVGVVVTLIAVYFITLTTSVWFRMLFAFGLFLILFGRSIATAVTSGRAK